LGGPDRSLHYHGRVGSAASTRIAAFLTAVATAFVIVAVSIVPFLSPPWVSFEQGRARADLWTGFTPDELNAATGSILSDLVFGPPNFDVGVNGQPVLNEREQAHMRDVRGVFTGFAALAIVAAAGLVVAYAGARRLGHPERWWRAVRAGAVGTLVGVVIGGFISVFAFDAAFEVFHRLFFAGGTYLFDPRTDRLVQLFPFAFWDETTMALGAVIVVLAVLVAFVANRRARVLTARSAAPPQAAEVRRADAEPRPGQEPAT
jgi:integral membrane protein (TIGR01906 family)